MIALPKYALQERSPRHGGEKDLLASFAGDERETITVEIGHCDGGQLEFSLSRSGLRESCFSKNEMAKVIEVAQALFAALP